MSVGEASKGAPTVSSLQYSKEMVDIILDDEFVTSRDGGFRRFLVKWHGCPDSDATWIQVGLKMSRNINDISSIFQVSGHPDMIFANENRFLEKFEKTNFLKIADISVIYQYILHKNAGL